MAESDFISIVKRIPDLNVEYAIGAMGGSDELYIKTLTHVVRLIPSNIREMERFLNENHDLGAFAVKTHGIKSALRHVGKTLLADSAEALEKAAKAGDRAYCSQHYGLFREELMLFYDQVGEAVSQSTKTEETAGTGTISAIGDFSDALMRARASAEDFDTMSAAEILLPLTKRRFGGDTDLLIAKAMEALDLFKPRESLEYITELLGRCGKPARRPGSEEGP